MMPALWSGRPRRSGVLFHLDSASRPRTGNREIGVHDEDADQRRVPRVVEAVQPGPQPVDVVLDDAGRRVFAAVVQTTSTESWLASPYSVLRRLADVAGAVGRR